MLQLHIVSPLSVSLQVRLQVGQELTSRTTHLKGHRSPAASEKESSGHDGGGADGFGSLEPIASS